MKRNSTQRRAQLISALTTGDLSHIKQDNGKRLFFLRSPYDVGYYYLLKENRTGRTDLGFNKEPLTLQQVNEVTDREGYGGFIIIRSQIFSLVCVAAGIIPKPTHNLKGDLIKYIEYKGSANHNQNSAAA